MSCLESDCCSLWVVEHYPKMQMNKGRVIVAGSPTVRTFRKTGIYAGWINPAASCPNSLTFVQNTVPAHQCSPAISIAAARCAKQHSGPCEPPIKTFTPNMSSLPQTIQPELIVRGSRFAMPLLVVVMLIIAVCYFVFAQSDPFLSFGDIFMLFVAPFGALISMNFMTRAIFFDDRCQVSRTVIHYQNIVSVERGRFLLTIRYYRPNDSRAKPRNAKLSFYEMRRAEQEKCLDILRTRLPAKAVSSL